MLTDKELKELHEANYGISPDKFEKAKLTVLLGIHDALVKQNQILSRIIDLLPSKPADVQEAGVKADEKSKQKQGKKKR